jgi:hypothetical protein
MPVPDISKDLIEAGRKLLAALDSAGLGAQGAAWIFFHDLEDWRFVVATSLVESMGRSKVYKLLLDVMKQLDVPKELTVEDIHLISTEGPVYTTIGRIFRLAGGGTARVSDCTINGAKIDALIYRWGDDSPSANEMKRVERSFRRRIKELSG